MGRVYLDWYLGSLAIYLAFQTIENSDFFMHTFFSVEFFTLVPVRKILWLDDSLSVMRKGIYVFGYTGY